MDFGLTATTYKRYLISLLLATKTIMIEKYNK